MSGTTLPDTMRWHLLSSVLLLAACGGTVAPDPGTEEPLDCQAAYGWATVKVEDALGAPVAGATVEAMHVDTRYTQAGTTNAQGVTTAVTQDIGAGTVRVRAFHGTRESDTAQLEFICGECSCTAEPRSITLRFAD
ncbi:MAG: carboxypeptidase-like regulatory domain-containing protein [Myxococcaceae bacterium]|nr:carboxypeptidase-like regulatory domain-containing protein [Myxococcaceae bacterium]